MLHAADFRRNPPFMRSRLAARTTSARGRMMRILSFVLIGLAAVSLTQPVDSQEVPAGSAMTYADLADLALTAPVAAHVRVRRAAALSAREAAGVPAGYSRFLVEADIVALIRGAGGLPGRVSYLADLPNDSRGRAPRLRRGTEYLVLATPVAGRPAELRLAARDAQLPFSAEAAARLRDLLREASATGAAPRITGIGRAFHVPGSLPGESETQFFLQTADNRPISINVLRRPGEQPRWSVALGELVDDAAAEPEPNSLLWYRLACSLPSTLPRRALEDAGREEVRAIQADYRLILERLGTCVRTRQQR